MKAFCSGMYFIWDRRVLTDDKVIGLTFDDGPNGEATEKFLEVLNKHNVRGTFFVIGQNVERAPHLARRIVQEGHHLGNHSCNSGHGLFLQSRESIKENLQKSNDIIYKTTGYRPRYFRPPNGLMNATMEEVVAELGLGVARVNAFAFDNFFCCPKTIANLILRQVKGGPLIMVLHDGFGTLTDPSRQAAAVALDTIIPELKSRGYRFAGLDECIGRA